MMADIHTALPELYLAVMAMFLLMVTAYKCKRVCNAMINGTLFTLAATVWFLWPHLGQEPTLAFNGLFAKSGFIAFAKILVLAAAFLVVLMSGGWMKAANTLKPSPCGRGLGEGVSLPLTSHAGKDPHPGPLPQGEGEQGRPSEFLVLMLFSVLGMLLMVSANDLLSLYMGLEMSSLALYVLAAFERDHPKSNEAGLKYFVLGALASGMMLFGMSLVYGFAGSTGFDTLAEHFAGNAASKGVIVGMILIIIGFCFKLSAVPFHMWAPDVYEGAPTPVTAFFATAPKIAALALFTRVLLGPFNELIGQWEQVVIFVSVASMVVGALAAIMQTNIKRLLAYSSISHVGFMLMAVAAGNQIGVQAILIYLGVYIFMSAGAFGCVLLMKRGGNAVEEIKDLAGLSQTHPGMAFAFAVFMFSLAGIPPLAGFFGKMYVVMAAVDAGLIQLAIIGVVTSVIGCYYYLKVVRVMYFDEPAWGFDTDAPFSLKLGVTAGAAVTSLFFLMPTPLVAAAKIAAEALIK